MKFTPIQPPRVFQVGADHPIQISDCARIELAPDEQVTFVTESGTEYDVARKVWGYYATPSLNGRLQKFGLRALLVKGPGEKFYVLLVERGHEDQMQKYFDAEGHQIISWLDTDSPPILGGAGGGKKQSINSLEQTTPSPSLTKEGSVASHSCLCGGTKFSDVFVYTSPPEGEVRFQSSASSTYRRKIIRCKNCGHFLSTHEMDLRSLYSAEYVNSTYSDGLRKAFDRIMALPPEKSDNAGRVRRILDFTADQPRSILDVGSGLCVFLARMKAAGWKCTALDPDHRAVAHAKEVVGINAIHGDFMTIPDLGRYHVITFNKVLEHVEDPVAMLAKSSSHLAPGGFVYVELPDGEMAVADGPGREEFFIDHWHVFSASSLTHLAARAGFVLVSMERLREPSTKYTLRAFLRPALEKQQ